MSLSRSAAEGVFEDDVCEADIAHSVVFTSPSSVPDGRISLISTL